MCNQYRPKLITTKRDGKVAIWIKMSNRESYNIWDLGKKEATSNVKQAIMVAFELGFEAHRQLVDGVQRTVDVELDVVEK